MRALLKDSVDDTYIVVEAIEMNYDPKDCILCVLMCDRSYYAVRVSSSSGAVEKIKLAFTHGTVDLSEYRAEHNAADVVEMQLVGDE